MFNNISLEMNKGKTLIIIDYRLYREMYGNFFFPYTQYILKFVFEIIKIEGLMSRFHYYTLHI